MDADNESVEGETGSCPPEPFFMSNFVSNLIQLGTRPSDPRGAWASLSQYVTGEQWIPANERNNTVHPTSHSNAAVNQSICYNARSSNVVWNQESIPRWILKEDPSKVSKELRLRMILTIARDEWFFGISKKAVEQMNKKRSKKRPVDQSESLVPHIEQLSKEVKRAYVKKENNQN